MRYFASFVNACDLVNRFIIKWCAFAATILLIVLSCTVFTAVVFRMVVNSPFSWTDEFSKYCMVWLTFLGAPVVAARASHVKVDMLLNLFSPTVRHITRILIALLCIAVLVLFVKYGWQFAVASRPQAIIVMRNISMFWIYVSVPVGSAIFLFSESVEVLKQILALCRNEIQQAED